MKIVVAVLVLVLGVVACDRVVELYPRPDASSVIPDARIPDGPGPLPDAHIPGSDGSGLPDGAVVFDASLPD